MGWDLLGNFKVYFSDLKVIYLCHFTMLYSYVEKVSD